MKRLTIFLVLIGLFPILATSQETILLDAAYEIEIYNLGYVATANKVLFNGLSFANGQDVVGEISL